KDSSAAKPPARHLWGQSPHTPKLACQKLAEMFKSPAPKNTSRPTSLHGGPGSFFGGRVAIFETVGLDHHASQDALVECERRRVRRRHRRPPLVANGEADESVGDRRRRRYMTFADRHSVARQDDIAL